MVVRGLFDLFEAFKQAFALLSRGVEVVLHAFQFLCFLLVRVFQLLDEAFRAVELVKGFFERADELVILVEADEDAWHFGITCAC